MLKLNEVSMSNVKEIRFLYLLLFFFSGVSSLLYEISWIRESSLVFGATLPALSTVTAIFFGGMAVGNFIFSKKPYSWKLYGKIQLGISILAISSIVIFNLIYTYNTIPAFISDSHVVLTLFRVFVVSIALLPATILIGGTFPVMMGLFPTSKEGEGKTVGLVNGINTLGAVGGALLAGFVLFEKIGAIGAIQLAVVVNFVIFIVSSKIKENEQISTENKSHNVEGEKVNIVLTLSFLIGLVGVASQVLWSRFLALIVNNTVYTYTVTIATVIIGLSIGSFIAGLFDSKIKNRGAAIGIVLIGNVSSFLIALLLPASLWLHITSGDSIAHNILVISAIMLLPALFSGMTFPLLVEFAEQNVENRGAISGLISAANTIGGILASLIFGFIILPKLGIGWTIVIIASITLISIIIAYKSSPRNYSFLFLVLPIIALLFLWRTPSKFVQDFLIDNSSSNRLIHFEEGELSTISVYKNGEYKTMKIDRLWQGESRKTRQIMAAHIPMLLSPKKVNDVAVIGVGPGVTANRFLMYNVTSLDLVDIEKSVFSTAQKYFNGGWMNDSNVTIIVDDGRSFLKYNSKKYDIISIEIGQVFRPYSASFYSKEYYELVANRLQDNGVVGQFVPLAAFNFEEFKRVIKTFIEVFPHAQLWYNRSEFVLVGSKGELNNLNSFKFKKWLSRPTDVFKDLNYNYWGGERYNLNKKSVLAGSYLYGIKELEKLTEDVKPYSDRVAELEYSAARDQNNAPFIDSLFPYLSPITDVYPTVDLMGRSKIEDIRKRNLNDIYSEELLLLYDETGDKRLLDKAIEFNNDNVKILTLLSDIYWQQGDYKSCAENLKRLYKLEPKNVVVGRKLATLMIKDGDLESAVQFLLQMVEINPYDSKTHEMLGATLLQGRNIEKAKYHLEIALQLDPNNSSAKQAMEYIYNLGKAKSEEK